MKIDEITTPLMNGLKMVAGGKPYFIDPVYQWTDPRPVAEFVNSLFYLGEETVAEKYCDWLVSVQNKNGSWNEVVPFYNEESCVATPIIGRTLLIGYEATNKRAYLTGALRALSYLQEKEFLPGYFIKSYHHCGDVLNVNATCAAFLQKAYSVTKDRQWLLMRDRAIYNVVRYQFKDGAYPYAVRQQTFPYEHHLNLRDPHYHAITLYFLLLADPDRSNRYFAISYAKAIKWLENEFIHGRVDWSHCDHVFITGVTGGYGYASYCAVANGSKTVLQNILQHLQRIQRPDGLFNHYERCNIWMLCKGIFREFFDLRSISPPGFSFGVRLARARRRISRGLKQQRNPKVSLYYSAQILDCLTETIKRYKRQ